MSLNDDLIEELRELPQADKLQAILEAALRTWRDLHECEPADLPQLILIGAIDEICIPSAMVKPSAADLKKLSNVLADEAENLANGDRTTT